MRALRAGRRLIERIVMGRRAYKFIIRDWVRLSDATAAADVMATMRFSVNLEPVELPGPSQKRIVVVAPHPDDEMIGPGGTIIQSIQAGKTVDVLYLTDGHEGPESKRVEETVAVAKTVGYSTEFLDLGKGWEADPQTVGMVASRIRSRRPHAVFVPFVLDDHIEHRMASLLLGTAYDQGDLPGDIEVWAYQVYSSLLPNVVVDITTVRDEKEQAIRMWRDSAMRSRDWSHYALGLNAYNSRMLKRPPGEHYVESFFVLPLSEYASLCDAYASGIKSG